MRRHALVVLCGCNSFFDLRSTQQIDAAYFDAPTDAPYACPPIGTSPQFSTVLTQHLLQDCDFYALYGERAIATCKIGGVSYRIAEGPPQGPLMPAQGLDDLAFQQPMARLSPDGQRLYARDSFSLQSTLRYYTRGPAGWMRMVDPPVPSIQSVGTVATGPTGDVLLLSVWTVGQQEWTNENGTWRKLADHSITALGGREYRIMNMTSDGLRAIALHNNRTYVTDRAAIGEPFRIVEPLVGGMIAADVFMTDDCSKLFGAGLGSVFYEVPR